MIAHYIDRRGTDLKGLRAQLAEDRRSRIAEALAQNDADVAKGKRSKTQVQIAADAGEDINAGMVMHYLTEFDTRPKLPQKPKAPNLTGEQKEQIEKLLSADITMEHNEIARRVGCKPTQVSKHVDRNAKHLKKRTFGHYERRPTEEVEVSDEKIKKLIRENMNIRDTEIYEGLGISKGMLRAFFKRNPNLQLAFRK
jgi:DNA-binding MarR family transcriptional regulator